MELDIKERNILLAEGEQANLQARSKPYKPRPADVERLWEQLYISTKGWWRSQGKDLSSPAKNTLKDLPQTLDNICNQITYDHIAQHQTEFDQTVENLMPEWREKNLKSSPEKRLTEEGVRASAKEKVFNRSKQQFAELQYPVATLWGMLNTLATQLNTIDQLQKKTDRSPTDEQVLQQEKALLLNGIAALAETFKLYNIPAQCVMTDFAYLLFEKIVNETEQTRWRTQRQ
jgi:hypothetical protein